MTKIMILLSEEQIFERYSSLPIDLIGVLNSGDISEDIQQIGNTRNLSPEKIEDIGFIVGSIILGFIHPNDLSREIQSELGLTAQIAKSIAREIEQKIFAPIRTELEKNYQPLTSAPGAKKTEPEIKSFGIPIIKTAPATTPTMPSPSIPVAPKIVSGPPSGPAPATLAVPPTPKVPPSTTIPILSVPPAPPSPSTPTTVQPVQPVSLNDLAKIAGQTPTKPAAPSTTQPFIIHKETAPEPIYKKAVSFPLFGWLKKTEAKKTLETPKAEIEMFGDKPAKPKEKKEPELVKTEIPKQKVVHYAQAETSSPFGNLPEKPAPLPAAPLPKTETKTGFQIPVRRVEFSKPTAETEKPKIESPKPPAEKTLDFLQSVIQPIESDKTEPNKTAIEPPIKPTKPVFQKPEPNPIKPVVQTTTAIKPPEKINQIPETDKISEPAKPAEETINPASAKPEKISPKPQNQLEIISSSSAAKTEEPIMINLDSFKITKKN